MVTIINFEEQMRGWLSYVAASKRLGRELEGYARLHRLIVDYQTQTILPFNAAAAARFAQLQKARIRIGTMDLKIAAVALSLDVPLATRNIRDFARVPGLQLLDWSK